MHKSSKVYSRLGEVLGLKDESVVLSIIVRKIVDALDYWARRFVLLQLLYIHITAKKMHSDKIIEAALKLFSELCLGYSSVRRYAC